MSVGDVLRPLGTSLGSVHLIKYIFVLDICCQQFEGYIFWYWIICSQQLGYICQLGGVCAPFGRRLADLQTLWLSDLMVVWPYGRPTLWSSDLMVVRPLVVWPYGRPTLWSSDLMVVRYSSMLSHYIKPYGRPALWLSRENEEIMDWPLIVQWKCKTYGLTLWLSMLMVVLLMDVC